MNIKTFILSLIGICFFAGVCQSSLMAMEKELHEKQQSKFEKELQENPQSKKAFEICVNLVIWALEKFFKSWEGHQKTAGLKELVHDIKHIRSYYTGQCERYFYIAIITLCSLAQCFSCENSERGVAMKYLMSDVTFLHAVLIQDLAKFVKKTKECKFGFKQDWLSHEKVKKLLDTESTSVGNYKVISLKNDKSDWSYSLHMSVDSDLYSSVFSDTEGLKNDCYEETVFGGLFGDEQNETKNYYQMDQENMFGNDPLFEFSIPLHGMKENWDSDYSSSDGHIF